MHIFLGAQKEVVGLEAVRPLDANALHLGCMQVGRDLLDNHLAQAVLNLEEVEKSLVEFCKPQRLPRLRIGQLDGQA